MFERMSGRDRRGRRRPLPAERDFCASFPICRLSSDGRLLTSREIFHRIRHPCRKNRWHLIHSEASVVEAAHCQRSGVEVAEVVVQERMSEEAAILKIIVRTVFPEERLERPCLWDSKSRRLSSGLLYKYPWI